MLPSLPLLLLWVLEGVQLLCCAVLVQCANFCACAHEYAAVLGAAHAQRVWLMWLVVLLLFLVVEVEGVRLLCVRWMVLVVGAMWGKQVVQQGGLRSRLGGGKRVLVAASDAAQHARGLVGCQRVSSGLQVVSMCVPTVLAISRCNLAPQQKGEVLIDIYKRAKGACPCRPWRP